MTPTGPPLASTTLYLSLLVCRPTVQRRSTTIELKFYRRRIRPSPRGTPTNFGRNKGGVAAFRRKPAIYLKRSNVATAN